MYPKCVDPSYMHGPIRTALASLLLLVLSRLHLARIDLLTIQLYHMNSREVNPLVTLYIERI